MFANESRVLQINAGNALKSIVAGALCSLAVATAYGEPMRLTDPHDDVFPDISRRESTRELDTATIVPKSEPESLGVEVSSERLAASFYTGRAPGASTVLAVNGDVSLLRDLVTEKMERSDVSADATQRASTPVVVGQPSVVHSATVGSSAGHDTASGPAAIVQTTTLAESTVVAEPTNSSDSAITTEPLRVERSATAIEPSIVPESDQDTRSLQPGVLASPTDTAEATEPLLQAAPLHASLESSGNETSGLDQSAIGAAGEDSAQEKLTSDTASVEGGESDGKKVDGTPTARIETVEVFAKKLLQEKLRNEAAAPVNPMKEPAPLPRNLGIVGPSNLELVYIVGQRERARAYVRINKQYTRMWEPGEFVAGWRLLEIGSDYVDVIQGDDQSRLYLSSGRNERSASR